MDLRPRARPSSPPTTWSARGSASAPPATPSTCPRPRRARSSTTSRRAAPSSASEGFLPAYVDLSPARRVPPARRGLRARGSGGAHRGAARRARPGRRGRGAEGEASRTSPYRRSTRPRRTSRRCSASARWRRCTAPASRGSSRARAARRARSSASRSRPRTRRPWRRTTSPTWSAPSRRPGPRGGRRARSSRWCGACARWQEAGLAVVVAARAETQVERLTTLLRHQDLAVKARLGAFDPAWLDDAQGRGTALVVVGGRWPAASSRPAEGLALVTEEEIFGARAHRRPRRAPSRRTRARAVPRGPAQPRRRRLRRPRRARHRPLPGPRPQGSRRRSPSTCSPSSTPAATSSTSPSTG